MSCNPLILALKFLSQTIVEPGNPGAVLSTIKERAIARWGEDAWQLEIAREYVRLARQQGDEKATINSGKSQIQRAFSVGSCRLDTAMLLAAAVGCRFQMVCTEVSVTEF
mgnify:CR=1 FL=1